MNTKTEMATARPWQQQGCSVYQADSWLEGHNYGGKFVVGIENAEADDGYLEPTEERMANAALICQAVNEHAALVRVENMARLLELNLPTGLDANVRLLRDELWAALSEITALRSSVGGKAQEGGL